MDVVLRSRGVVVRSLVARHGLLVLTVSSLAACGDDAPSRAGASDARTAPRIDASVAIGSPEAGAPLDGPPQAACVDPCFAAGVFTGKPISMAVRDGVVYVAVRRSSDALPDERMPDTIIAVAPDKHVTVLAHVAAAPSKLLVDATSVYWLNRGEHVNNRFRNPAVMKVGRDHGSPEVLALEPPPDVGIFDAPFLGDDNVYFAAFVERIASIRAVPVAGGETHTFIESDMLDPSIDVHVVPRSMAVRGDTIYWIDTFGGLAKMPKAGGPPQFILPPPSVVSGGLSITDQAFYFIAGRADAVGIADLVTLPLGGGQVTTLVAGVATGGVGQIWTLIDGNSLYYGDVSFPEDGDSYRVALEGGSPVRVAPSGVFALDETYLYWADSTGRVYRTAK